MYCGTTVALWASVGRSDVEIDLALGTLDLWIPARNGEQSSNAKTTTEDATVGGGYDGVSMTQLTRRI